jgi:hypothetical protein
MSIRSYVRSTDFHRKPCSKNILCGVNIPIMVYPRMRTIPFTNIQRQFFNDVPTVVTPFRTRKPSVNLDQCAAIPITLVLKLSDQLTPTRIADREGKFPVLHHILQGQILNSNRLVFGYQSSCQLVKEILSAISNFLMHFCDEEPRLISIVRSLLLTTQLLLSFLELATFCIKDFGVYNLFTVTQSHQTRNTQVNPNFIGLFRQWFNLGIHQQGNRPSSSSREFHRNCRWACTFGQFSTPTDCKWRSRIWPETLAHFSTYITI